MDSDLEAFSRYPTHVSFAALADQPTAYTNNVMQQVLSYLAALLLQKHYFHQ
jgi:hypothetical protein